ncbi:DMT family transporter [Streptomyces radicis]|uniref:DMT family transporter n=1 Tax=Streptomyces radicis TaxID=1750517 RepID=A0A3A9W769_9ACTN|nr:DMT family transporter [Streptomyces radicis]RKN09025.1 DMT family transporter [Streptomyces radicis]RKN22784.1 DMT family transporter [Streptomyces radicis]
MAATPAAPSGTRLDALLLTVALTTVSVSGPLAAATAAPALAIAFWRNALAVAGLAPVMALRRRLRAELAATSRRTVLLSLASGAALAAHFGLWLPSLHLTSVASSVALVTTTPVWTTLLLRMTGHRPPAAVWGGAAIAFAGVLVLTGVDLSLSAEALAGDALALGGGIAAAGYVLIGAEVRRTTSTTTYTFLCYGATAALLLVVCLLAGASLGAGYAGETWLKLLALTATAQLLGHSLINRVVRGLGPSITSTALLLETPGAALIAAVWLGQLPPAAAYPALALILLGLALVIRAERGVTPERATVDAPLDERAEPVR